ncbi:MAG TPA: hypothetical protein VMR23_16700 [Candidatus Limnocylindria bacterium]|nr:hypothetical protein [Candidatus Limnocylindria bacterium]
MIRMSVMYPTTAGKTFDYDYYTNKHMNSVGDLQAVMQSHGKELMADVPNFTDITPQVQISEVIA